VSSILETLGIDVDNIGASDLIASAVLLIRVIEEDGTEFVGHYSSHGLSFVEKVGMLRVAERMTLGQIGDIPNEGDD